VEGGCSDSAQATAGSEKCAIQQCGFNEHDSMEHGLREKRYLIWAIRFDHGLPSSRGDAPREVRVRGPLNQESFSGAQAVAFIEGFNATMFAQGKPIWAIALPREFDALQYLRADIRPS